MLYKVAKVAREKQGRKVERGKDEGGTRSKKRSSSRNMLSLGLGSMVVICNVCVTGLSAERVK